MSRPHRVHPRLYALVGAFCVVPCILVLASLPWLKEQPKDLVFLITGTAGFVTVLAGLVLGIIHDRTMDEVQKSNSRFASFWGEAAATTLVALLLNLPTGREAIVSLVTRVADVSQPDQLVILAFVFGFFALVMARMVCMALLSISWAVWKSRPAQDHA